MKCCNKAPNLTAFGQRFDEISPTNFIMRFLVHPIYKSDTLQKSLLQSGIILLIIIPNTSEYH